MTISGSVTAASAPPSGSDAWRRPRAKPRSSAANQCITARPLAELTLEPAALASASKNTSATKSSTKATPATSRPIPARPTVSDHRSPKRSAASPQRRSVQIGPSQTLASAIPTSVSVRSNSSWRVGASTGGLSSTAEYAVAPAVPAARTAQR